MFGSVLEQTMELLYYSCAGLLTRLQMYTNNLHTNRTLFRLMCT